MKRLTLAMLVALAVAAPAAEAHTLYGGPARGTAAAFARALGGAINADQTTTLMATSAGATSCLAIDRHSRNCGVYLYLRDTAQPQLGAGRCDFRVRVAFVSATSYARRVTGYTRPECLQALRALR